MRGIPWLFLVACGDGVEPADRGPTSRGPILAPEAPRAGLDTLSCASSGPVAWTLDGEPMALGAVVEPWELKPGRWACTGEEGTRAVDVEAVGGNLLLVLLDDIGVDQTAAWGLHPDTPPMPTLDRLVEQGVRFDAAYAHPLCSPTRGAMLTGKLPGRTGLGHLVEKEGEEDWLEGHSTFAQHLRDAGYATAVLGKWHVAPNQPEYLDHPARMGFDLHRGTMDNPDARQEDPGVHDYFRWQENRDGVFVTREGYLTTATIDDAIEAVTTLPEPWLVYVPLNGAHVPLHEPPADLFEAEAPLEGDVALYRAMVEATDRELGRLIDSLGTLAERTTVVVLSDNGTNDVPMVPPSDPLRSKGHVYEGGVQVPMVVVAPWAVPGRHTDALVHVTDVYAAALDLAGVRGDDQLRDAVSFLPYAADPSRPSRRELLYTESFRPNGRTDHINRKQMIRDDRYMLIRGEYGLPDQLFVLEPDTLGEGEALPDPERTHPEELRRLRDAMDALVEDMRP